MLQHWFDPLDSSIFDLVDDQAENTFIGNVQLYVDAFPILSNIEIIIFGIGGDGLFAIREQLYQMPFPFGKVKLADLGNIKNQNKDFIFPILQELYISGITPIILSENQNADFFVKAYRQNIDQASFCIVDETIQHRILENLTGAGFAFTGIQSQFLTKPKRELFNDVHHDYVRLSAIRQDIKEVEPEIRNADVMIFNSDALKKAEFPANCSPNPNGLFSEEACQIVRYAGFNENLSSLCLVGYDYVLDKTEQSASLFAQLIWFFLEGLDNRQVDYPDTSVKLQEYVVNVPSSDLSLSFWHSRRSDRWWFSLNEASSLLPCSKNDYNSAKKDQLTTRILKLLERT